MKSLRTALLGAAVAACLLAGAAGAEEWRPFSGTWTLAGKRFSLPTEGPRRASVIHASGSLVITKGETLGRGFYGEVVGFDDGETLLVGRAVFTDSIGQKIFATLKAQPLGGDRTATATITGGTGRWSGLEGTFTFSWRFVVETGEEDFDALAVNLEGRVRRASAPAPGQSPAPGEAPK
jgi:hypothetical protein